MKILYVSQYFPPEMGAPAARVSELSRHWVSAGHEVTVLTGFPNHPTGVLASEYKKKIWRGVFSEEIDGVHVVRTWLLPFANRGAFRRILNYISFCFSAMLTGTFLSGRDVVIGTSPQLLVGLAGWWISLWKHAPFVFEVRDLWPESLAAVGAGNEGSFLHRALGRIAGFLYRHSDRIVVVTPAFKTHLVHHWHVSEKKIAVVENGVETNLFDSNAVADAASVLREEWKSNDKFIVCYVGTLGMAHGLETLLDAAGQLLGSNSNVLFVLAGEGAEKEHIMASAHERGLRNVKFVNQQPRSAIPGYIAACDVCLVLLKKSEVFKTVIPTKMLEFMSCARPVILGVDGQAREVLEEAGAGLFIEPENATALRDAILKLAGDPVSLKYFGENGRKYALEKASRQATAQIYLLTLKELLQEKLIARQ